MNQLEQFSNEDKSKQQIYSGENLETKKITEKIIEQQKQLDEINKEIYELEHFSYFGKVLNSIIGRQSFLQSKLTILYQHRRSTEALLEKLKGGDREH